MALPHRPLTSREPQVFFAGIDPWFRSLDDFFSFVRLDPASAPYPLAGDAGFSFLTTRSFASRMRAGDWFDPLLRQVLPTAAEEEIRVGFGDDPVGDGTALIAPGLLQKYPGRALMICSGACAVHCRHCFRRGFAFDGPLEDNDRDTAWRCLRRRPDLTELILSGGDPLMLDNAQFAAVTRHTVALPHVRTLRIHTRAPVVLPDRIDSGIVDIVRSAARRIRVVIVVQVNHANEIDSAVAGALDNLRAAGAMLLNQSVLLKGVNDSRDALASLSRRLVDVGVLPYYLHQLDRVRGAHHFEVDVLSGRELVESLRACLPGYAVPRYVRELAGASGKSALV